MISDAINMATLAQLDHWQRLGEGLRGSRTRVDFADLLPYLLLTVAVGAGVAAFVGWRRRNDFSRRADDPHKLFRELCAIHQLDVSSQSLLKQLAAEMHYKQPAQVFLSPSVFEKPGLPAALEAKAPQFQALRQRLFR